MIMMLIMTAADTTAIVLWVRFFIGAELRFERVFQCSYYCSSLIDFIIFLGGSRSILLSV